MAMRHDTAGPRVTLQNILDAGYDLSSVLDGAFDLDPTSSSPVIVDESANLIDGYHRVAGMIQWATARGLDMAVVVIPVVVIPDELGEDLFGLGISDAEAADLICQYG